MRKRPRSVAAFGCLLLFGAALTACGGEDQQPEQERARETDPAPRPEPRPEPVRPERITKHDRVEFPETLMRAAGRAAQPIATLASAVATGDADAMRDLLSGDDQRVLDAMVESGVWDESTSGLEAVAVETVTGGGGTVGVTLSVRRADGSYRVRFDGAGSGDAWTFTAAPAVETVGPATATETTGEDGGDRNARQQDEERA